jgi:hypothetical protein
MPVVKPQRIVPQIYYAVKMGYVYLALKVVVRKDLHVQMINVKLTPIVRIILTVLMDGYVMKLNVKP